MGAPARLVETVLEVWYDTQNTAIAGRHDLGARRLIRPDVWPRRLRSRRSHRAPSERRNTGRAGSRADREGMSDTVLADRDFIARRSTPDKAKIRAQSAI